MMKDYLKHVRSVLAFAVFLVMVKTGGVYATDSDWVLRKDQDGIRVYSQSLPGSQIDKVRCVTILETSLNRLVTLLRDPQQRQSWDTLCGEAYVYERITDTQELVYLHVNLPWPVSDRDMLMRTRWVQDDDTLKVQMFSAAERNALPPVNGLVRVKRASHFWEFTPLGNGKVQVITVAHLDPEGALPAWLLNKLAVESPFKALENIRLMIEDNNFIHRHYDFIKEPIVRRPDALAP